MKKVLALAAAGMFLFSVSANAEGGCGGYKAVTAGTHSPVKTILETATDKTSQSTKSGS